MTLKGRFGFCVVCGNCGGAGRACGSGNGVRSNNVSIKIAAAIGYAYAKGAQNLATARLSKQSTERDTNRRLRRIKSVQIFFGISAVERQVETTQSNSNVKALATIPGSEAMCPTGGFECWSASPPPSFAATTTIFHLVALLTLLDQL